MSQRGIKYTNNDIEPEVRSAANIIINYGPASYMDRGIEAEYARSSTQINFQNMRIVRRGICFGQIDKILREDFGISLSVPVSTLTLNALEYEFPVTILAI